MAFQSLVPNAPLMHSLAEDITKLIRGTVQLGTTWGHIKTATITRTGDEDTLLNNRGNLRAWCLRNPRTEMDLTVTWEAGQDGPTLGSTIAIPFMGVNGVVKEIGASWTEEGWRTMQIKAGAWDGLPTGVTSVMNFSGGFGPESDPDDSSAAPKFPGWGQGGKRFRARWLS